MAAPRWAKSMSDFGLLTRRLVYLTEAQDKGFAEMSRAVGLDPARDFRNADLSGVDLRGQDLKGFNFGRSKMTGARIHGAAFRPALSKWQFLSADKNGRAVCLLVGVLLESVLGQLRQALEPGVLVPPEPNQALQRVGREREQHYGAGGTFLSDGRVAISRILSRSLRNSEAMLKHASTTILFFQPTTDFDFDTLGVLQQKLRRINRRHITFVFPAFMEGENGRRLFEVREKTAFVDRADTVIFRRVVTGRDQYEAQAENSRYLQHVVDWLALLDRARLAARSTGARTSRDAKGAEFISGVVRPSASILDALRDQIVPQQIGNLLPTAPRRHLYLSETVAASTDLAAVASMLGSEHRSVSISIFPDAIDIVNRYYLVTAPDGSAISSLTR